MALELVGMIGTRSASEIDGPAKSLVGGHVEPEFVRDFARAHEEAGFDKVLVGYGSSGPDGFGVASYAAGQTERLGYLIAHRPGFVVPTLAARKAATLDQFSRGRVSIHIITGGHDAEQQRDGDFLDKDSRYRRTGEYLDVMRKEWGPEQPFDYDGEFYQFRKAASEVKPYRPEGIPLYFGGMSGPALPVGARHADVFMMWGEPVAEVCAKMDEVRAEAAKFGRTPNFSVSFRPILAATEAAAWEKAHRYLDTILRVGGTAALAPSGRAKPQAEGSQRLLALAERGDVHDGRLWTAIARAVGAYGNTTALVGTPEQVAESLLRYYDAGVRTILIRGFEPLPDATEYGRELIPLLRAEVAKRDAVAKEREAVLAG